MQELDSFLAEMFGEGPPISTNAHLLPFTNADQTHGVAPVAEIGTPSDVGTVTTTAEQAKSMLAGLNRDTAIRLRWALRDIKPSERGYRPSARMT